jgi:hypothetical protein
MDKIVADEIERLERSVTDTDEVGNIKFGETE